MSVQQTMRVIADMHAKHTDVEIIFTSNVCATNGRTVYINAGSPQNETWVNLVEAKITHEVGGHIKHTDFGYAKEHLKGKSPLFCHVNNIIEDCRIETACMTEFTGAYWVFQKMTHLLFDEGYWSEPHPDDGIETNIMAWLLYTGRGLAVEGQSHLVTYGESAKQWLISQGVPASPFEAVEQRMSLWGGLGSTAETIKETEAILTLLNLLTEDLNDDSNEDSDGSQSGNDSDDDSNEDSDGNQSGDDSDDDSDEDSDGNQSGNDSDDDSDEDSDGNQSGNDSDDDSNEDSDGNQSGNDSDDDSDEDSDGNQSGNDSDDDSDEDSDGNQSGNDSDDDSNEDSDGSQSGNDKNDGSSRTPSTSQSVSTNPLLDEVLETLQFDFDDLHDVINQIIDQIARDRKSVV